MPDRSTAAMAPSLDLLFREGALGSLSDGQLLERFVASDSAAGSAFDVLVARHGPMVLGVCRRILRDAHAAEDAFQVTFLVLARRAAAIRQGESLGPWLHGVARRAALRARAAASLRREREARAAILHETVECELDHDDSGAALHAEIERLPEKYRAPIVLCYLQGRTIGDASRQLGWPVGTVGGRLARARDRLRASLQRRGLSVPVVLSRALSRDSVLTPAISQSLARATRDAALEVVIKRGTTTAISAAAAGVVEETMRHAILGRLVIVAIASGLAAAVVVVGGADLGVTAGSPEIARSRGPQGPSKTTPAPARPQQSPLVETLKDASRLADGVTDPQESLNAHMALAWAQIKTGDHQGARATLDRAEKTASALDAEARCVARVRVAQALGECGGKPRGLALLAQTLIEAESLGQSRQIWPLKSVAVAQSDLGDRDGARATIRALDQALLSPEERRRGIWKSTLSTLAEAQLVVGDIDAAFKTCIPGVAGEGGKADESEKLQHQAWMLTHLAYFAADGNHNSRSGLDPPRVLTAQERTSRLEVVRLIVATVESLPEPNSHRASLVAALGELGAFETAIQVARRIDQKQIQNPNQIDAIWAFWRVSLAQAKAGLFDAARVTLREAARVEVPPKADAADKRSCLANGFLAARDYDEAMKIAETLDPGGRASILSQVARRKKLAGDRDGAEQLFRRAILDAGRFRHMPPETEPEQPGAAPAAGPKSRKEDGANDAKAQHEIEFLSLLAQIQARNGDWAAAARTFASMSPESHRQRLTALWISIIRTRSGDAAGALAWARSLSSPSLRSVGPPWAGGGNLRR